MSIPFVVEPHMSLKFVLVAEFHFSNITEMEQKILTTAKEMLSVGQIWPFWTWLHYVQKGKEILNQIKDLVEDDLGDGIRK